MADPAPDPTPDPAPDPTPDPTPDPDAFVPIESQAQFDAMIQERIRRERAKFADYLDLKTKASKLDEIEAASKDELTKAQERIAALEDEAKSAAQSARESTLRSAVISEAAKRDVVDPDAAVALLDRSSSEFDDDGNPTNVASAMELLLEARPYLVKSNGGQRGSADQGARPGVEGQLGEDALATMSPSEINEARRAGRFDKLGGGTKR